MLRLVRLSKRFARGTANETLALDAVDLEVDHGERVAIIGTNGAGKSTLLAAVAGLVQPDNGRIELGGVDVTHEPLHRRARLVGRIAQDPAASTCGALTVEENLAMAARRGRPRRLGRAVTNLARAMFRDRLRDVGLGLEDRLGAPVRTLSGGQRQVLALLMATMAPLEILLLDEHVANLDPRTTEAVMRITARLAAEHQLLTLMVTHDMRRALEWGDRLLMMDAGRIVIDLDARGKRDLTVADLVRRFQEQERTILSTDRLLLGGHNRRS